MADGCCDSSFVPSVASLGCGDLDLLREVEGALLLNVFLSLLGDGQGLTEVCEELGLPGPIVSLSPRHTLLSSH